MICCLLAAEGVVAEDPVQRGQRLASASPDLVSHALVPPVPTHRPVPRTSSLDHCPHDRGAHRQAPELSTGSARHTPGPPLPNHGTPSKADGPAPREGTPGRRPPGSAGQRTNTPAWPARSRKYCGATPSTSVTATPTPIAVIVSGDGTATVGPSGRGSLKNISTMTRM